MNNNANNKVLSKLMEISTAEKSVLSLTLAGPGSVATLDKRIRRIRAVLKRDGTLKDEREYFEENVDMVHTYLEKNPLKHGSMCLFACWGLDFFLAVPMPIPCKDMIWFDSSPYIRPLVEFNDEYENVAVVLVDNKKARIYMISSAIPGSTTTVKGNIKNHVKKGGWSQQRYERRRDKQLLHYSREIVDVLIVLEKHDNIQRIVMAGGKEILQGITENLPKHLHKMVGQKPIDLHKGDQAVNSDVMMLFFELEREAEANLWEKIRSEFLRDGLGVVGLNDVLEAVKNGRAEEIIAVRDLAVQGFRCRECELLQLAGNSKCSECGSDSLFEVELVNEITELALQTGATVDFCDSIETLSDAGGIGAFLRYKL